MSFGRSVGCNCVCVRADFLLDHRAPYCRKPRNAHISGTFVSENSTPPGPIRVRNA